MKHFTLALLCFCLSGSLQADPISPRAARQLAQDYLSNDASAQPLSVRHRSASKGENQPYYIFSRGENKGYVIVSGDDCLPTILGYTEEGDFSEENMAPGLKSWLQHYESVVLNAQEHHAPARTAPRKAAGSKDIPVLITTHWHQSAPYNNMCPIIPSSGRRAATGCVATAASQILYYWRKDLYDVTQYPTPTYDWCTAPVKDVVKRGTPLKWDLLKTSYNGNENKEFSDAVALINYVVGTCCNMGYDESSGAYIADLVKPFERQFGLASKNVWKNSMNQTQWETLIYNDLAKSYPIEFAGYTKDWEGHAIVLDGYRRSTNLFHFNFGWGGQGDGWYTLDDETGVNGFGTEQSITYDIHPINLNAVADIKVMNNHLTSKMDNRVKVTITNNSTLPLSNFYVFFLGGTTKPSSISKANASNTSLVVKPGETKYFECEYKPATSSKLSVYVTDENLSIIGTLKSVPNESVVSQLTFNGLSIDTSGEYEEMEINGRMVKVHHIYDNSELKAWANFTQHADGDACQPNVYGYIYKLAPDLTSETKLLSSSSSTLCKPGEQATIAYKFNTLRSENIYKFAVADVANSSQPIVSDGTLDSVCYFKMMGRSIEATPVSETEVKLTGYYNLTYLSSLTGDPKVTSYDITGLKGVRADIAAANPNALFYANADQQIAGRNIIVDGVCADLQLEMGYDFSPREDFHAMKASLKVNCVDGKFSTLLLPFKADVPAGMFARKVTTVEGSYIRECEPNTTQFLPCTPHMVINSGVEYITASDVDVTTQAANQGNEQLVGTFRTIAVPEGGYLLDNADTQYFSPATVDSLLAFSACLLTEKKVRSTPTEYASRDKKNMQLAETIAEAYELINRYSYESSATASSSLQLAINEAAIDVTNYPESDSLNTVTKALEAAIDAFLASMPKTDEEGHLDFTEWIKNPSFESGSTLTGWTKSLATSSNTTSSESNFMSGVDGTKAAYIKKGGSIEQVIEGIENGEYILKASVAADYENSITVFANKEELTVEGSNFGPFYFKEITLPMFKVTDGKITLGAYAEEDWVKVDNFRLYQVQADAIQDILATPENASFNSSRYAGTYDLSGRRIAQPTKGVYIQQGKLILK